MRRRSGKTGPVACARRCFTFWRDAELDTTPGSAYSPGASSPAGFDGTQGGPARYRRLEPVLPRLGVPAAGVAAAGGIPARRALVVPADAPYDPWRDPYSPAAVVIDAVPPPDTREPEPVADPVPPATAPAATLLFRWWPRCWRVDLVGGVLGCTLAVRNGPAGVALGAAPGTVPTALTRPADSLASPSR